MPFLPHFLKALDKTATESVGEEECRATIGAAGDELQLTGTVDALVERHGAGSILATIAEGKNEGRGIWVNADTKGVSAPAGGNIAVGMFKHGLTPLWALMCYGSGTRNRLTKGKI